MCRRYILTLKYVIDNGYAIYTPEYDICLLVCFIGSGIRDGCSDTLYVHQIILLNYRYAHPREIIGIRTSLHSRVHHWHVNMLFTRHNILLTYGHALRDWHMYTFCAVQNMLPAYGHACENICYNTYSP